MNSNRNSFLVSLSAAILVTVILTSCGECKKTNEIALQEAQQKQAEAKVVAEQQAAENSCDKLPKMNNDDIIAEHQKCERAGMTSENLHCGDDYSVIRVQCKAKENNE